MKQEPETREFSTAALLSLTTGLLFCGFSEMHEAAEFLMGHPIWTHQFANKKLWLEMRRRIRAQVPEMPMRLAGVTPENCRQKLSAVERRIGKKFSIRRGDWRWFSTTMSPLDGIPQDKVVIIHV